MGVLWQLMFVRHKRAILSLDSENSSIKSTKFVTGKELFSHNLLKLLVMAEQSM